MLFGFEVLDVAAAEPLLFSVPESLGLLAFGIGLVSIAVILRWMLGKTDGDKPDRKMGE